MRDALVGVGSNQAQATNIAAGLAALSRQFGEVTASTTYEGPPAEGSGAPYWNLVVRFRTALNWSQLRAHLKGIEDLCGRRRGEAAGGVVTLDLDPLILGADGPSPEYDLPPEALPAYLALPLAELEPDWVHPGAGRNLAALAAVSAGAEALRPVAPPSPVFAADDDEIDADADADETWPA